MKKLIKTGFAFVLFTAMFMNFGLIGVSAQPGMSGTINYQTFYDELSPYGNWIEYPGYEHVWSPNVEGDFSPYLTNGNWEYTDDGWAWASNYDWGWAPFHYGRWLYEPQYGWLWVPGYEWSPAWVTWGEVDDYYAWAPLYPGVNVGYEYNNWRPNARYWNIVAREHIYDRDVHRWAESRAKDNIFADRIQILNNFNRTSIHNNYYSKGPEIKDVEKYTDRKITPVALKSVDRIMPSVREGNNLQVYRPNVVHSQPAVFKRITKETAPTQTVENNRMDSNLRTNPQGNMDVRKTESIEKVPQRLNGEQARIQANEKPNLDETMDVRRLESRNMEPQIQNREEARMSSIERSTQLQNVQRMPQMNRPPNSFETRIPTEIGIRRKN